MLELPVSFLRVDSLTSFVEHITDKLNINKAMIIMLKLNFFPILKRYF